MRWRCVSEENTEIPGGTSVGVRRRRRRSKVDTMLDSDEHREKKKVGKRWGFWRCVHAMSDQKASLSR